MTRPNPAEAGPDEVGTSVDHTPTPRQGATTSELSKGERDELAKLAKRRERTAKSGVEHRAAELLADAEAQLAAVYSANDETWAELTAEAKRLVDDLDAQIAERCRDLGVREEFRPGLSLSWYGRGANGDAQRRAELRKVAQTRIAAESKRAKHAIEVRTTDVLTELAAGALHSDEAHAFLASIPTPAELMPTLDIKALEAGR